MEIITKLLDLPISVKGFCVRKNDCYIICLNQHLSFEQNRESYLHELEHIKNGDFDSDISVNRLEMYAHKLRGD